MTDTDPSGRLIGAASPERVAGALVVALVAAVVLLSWSGVVDGLVPAGRAGSADESAAASPSAASSAAASPRIGQADLTAARTMIDRLNEIADDLAKEVGSARPRADLIAKSMQQANAAIVLARDPIDSLSAQASTTELGKALDKASTELHQELTAALSNSLRNTAVYVASAKEAVKLVQALAPRRAEIQSRLEASSASKAP